MLCKTTLTLIVVRQALPFCAYQTRKYLGAELRGRTSAECDESDSHQWYTSRKPGCRHREKRQTSNGMPQPDVLNKAKRPKQITQSTKIIGEGAQITDDELQDD